MSFKATFVANLTFFIMAFVSILMPLNDVSAMDFDSVLEDVVVNRATWKQNLDNNFSDNVNYLVTFDVTYNSCLAYEVAHTFGRTEFKSKLHVAARFIDDAGGTIRLDRSKIDDRDSYAEILSNTKLQIFFVSAELEKYCGSNYNLRLSTQVSTNAVFSIPYNKGLVSVYQNGVLALENKPR